VSCLILSFKRDFIEISQILDFGLPPTPPSSSPGDESKGNSSPEHGNASSSVTSTSSSSKKSQNASRGYSSSTRQPIHTPLISSQPKVSKDYFF
jgi:cyclic AMP-responsive element-binding protein 3